MIDFRNVRNIVIPDGDVAVIARGEQILWQKETKKYKAELEYIETTGTQWFDTGIEAPFTVEATLQGVEGGASSRVVLSMNGSASGGAWFGFTRTWTLGSSETFDNPYDEKIIAACVFSGSVLTCTIDGITKTRSRKTSGTLYVGSPSSAYPASCKIFSVKIYNANDEVVRDLIPVLDLNNRPCMYDKVTDELFYNQGTDEFLYKEVAQ